MTQLQFYYKFLVSFVNESSCQRDYRGLNLIVAE